MTNTLADWQTIVIRIHAEICDALPEASFIYLHRIDTYDGQNFGTGWQASCSHSSQRFEARGSDPAQCAELLIEKVREHLDFEAFKRARKS
jgi:hypothetical protein